MFDCKPQTGPCPLNCNQCFYNRPGAFYVNPDEPHMPTVEEVDDGIMRVNSGHDSNVGHDEVVAATEKYPRRFFNTAIPKFDFPAPVVFTANRQEEKPAWVPPEGFRPPDNLMYIRLRVSATNLTHVAHAIYAWAFWGIPIVLTFMAYYDGEPPKNDGFAVGQAGGPLYEWKKRHINSYWCPTRGFMAAVLRHMKRLEVPPRLVTMCGTLDSNLCRDCGNCETYYRQTVKHMQEIGAE